LAFAPLPRGDPGTSALGPVVGGVAGGEGDMDMRVTSSS